MPIGPPSQVPLPKSGCSLRSAPMLARYRALRAATGSRDTSACQMSPAGRLGQPRSDAPDGAEWVPVAVRDAEDAGWASGQDGPEPAGAARPVAGPARVARVGDSPGDSP